MAGGTYNLGQGGLQGMMAGRPAPGGMGGGMGGMGGPPPGGMGGQPTGATNWGGMNPYQQASTAQNQAMATTQGALNQNAQGQAQTYNPATMQGQGYNAAMQSDPSKISQGISGYMNPYTNDVIDQTANDINRQNQIQQTQNAGAASAAGAFGGSRHGLVEAQTNEASQRALANTSANLRNQGWQNAANLSGQDISNQMNVNAANQGATNAASQFGASAQNQAAANNQNAYNQAGQWNAGAQNQFAQNQFNNAMSGANQMAGLGQGSFNYGNAINNQMNAFGQQGQQMNQNLINQGAGMYDRYTNQPINNMNLRLGSLGQNPLTQTGTQTSGYNPGMMDYLGLAAGMGGSYLGGK